MEINRKTIFNRTELLLGEDVMERLAETRVILFGVGGVGSWCAEGLIRSGIGHLTIVDADDVSVSNINRQGMATVRTIGRPKVDALRDKLADINPDAEIVPLKKVYSAESGAEFNLDSFDYVVDAVDSLKNKAELILRACESGATFFSSMGAALKIDPARIRVAEFWDVRGCPLASAIRKKFKRNGTLPQKKFLCVFDDEVLTNRGSCARSETDLWNKASINGTTASVTAIFGFTLSGLVIQDIYRLATGTRA